MTTSLQHLLASDEKILWQGKPKASLRFEWDSPLMPLFYLFFTGFSIFWMIMASMAGGFFWTFGLLFFSIGVYGLLGIHFWKLYVRSFQNYTLTSQRALIENKVLGRRTLKTYPIIKTTEIIFKDADTTGDIIFAKHESRGLNGVPVTQEIGFEQIENPQNVLSLLRRVQENR